MKNQILIFSESSSPRLQYVLNFISEVLGAELKLVIDFSEFESYKGAKINYSKQEFHGISFVPHTLLFEKNIHQFDFQTLENDPCAMIFFLLSRYEEYLNFEPDKYGRFPSKSSYLKQTDRLQTAVVDRLILDLKDKIVENYQDFQFNSGAYSKQLTIDIDQAFLYRHKSLKRFLGGNLKDAQHFRFKKIMNRKLSYFGLKKDPWDVYEKIKIRIKPELKPIFFFQVGEYGDLDKNLPSENPAFRKVIRTIAEWAEVGLHPSFQSGDDLEMLKMEKRKLEEILGKPVTRSRQHYIRLQFPTTYRNLLSCGITQDYTMGFADDTGFRAGTAHPFFWYDLQQERQTELRIHPFCIMDVTLKDYLNLKSEHADFVLQSLEKEIKRTHGNMILICHNESLSGYDIWEGWDHVFMEFIHS